MKSLGGIRVRDVPSGALRMRSASSLEEKMTQVEDGLWSGEGPQQDQTMPGPGSWTSAFTAWINECLPSTPTLPYLWHFVGSPMRQRHVHFTSSPFQGSVTSHRLSLSCFLPNQHPYFFHSLYWPSGTQQAFYYPRVFVLDAFVLQYCSVDP